MNGHQLLNAPVGSHRTHLSTGTALLPPPLFWHCLRPRDLQGSHALRNVSFETSRGLLQIAAEEIGPENTFPRVLEAIKQRLPEVTHPRLRAGVLGAVAFAARLQHRLSSLEIFQETGSPRIATSG